MSKNFCFTPIRRRLLGIIIWIYLSSLWLVNDFICMIFLKVIWCGNMSIPFRNILDFWVIFWSCFLRFCIWWLVDWNSVVSVYCPLSVYCAGFVFLSIRFRLACYSCLKMSVCVVRCSVFSVGRRCLGAWEIWWYYWWLGSSRRLKERVARFVVLFC